MHYVSSHIDPLQFAYLRNRSTEDAINYFTNCVGTHIDKGKCYARCLFIDYSSAFNTIQPHIMLECLERYNVPHAMQLWILDFLSSRRQYVRTSNGISSIIEVNTGAPQGCVLSAFLFVIYTNALNMNSDFVKIIKYADDTVVIGLINKNDEQEYLGVIDYLVKWCNTNFLNLNVSKTKEMIIDFRSKKNMNVKKPIVTDNENFEIISSYPYIGCALQDNLKFDIHVNNQTKKANKRMYHVRCLSKLRVDNKIIAMFYNAVVSSVLTYAISCWFTSCTVKEKKRVDKFRKKTCKLVTADYRDSIYNISNIHSKQCLSLLARILKDPSHPLHTFFRFLPSGERLNVIPLKTDRARNTFVPVAIKLYNQR